MGHQLSLSFELICLMDWLLKQGKDKMRLMIKEALANGVARNLESVNEQDSNNVADNLHDTVIDFMLFLEDMLLQELEGVAPQVIMREKMAPTIQLMDNHQLDVKTLWLSLQQAKKAVIKNNQHIVAQGGNPEIEVKQELFKQLLKHWKPAQNEPIN